MTEVFVSGEPGNLAALWRMVELCLPGRGECGAATFRPQGEETLESDWEAWVAELYSTRLAPALPSLLQHAASGAFASLAADDATFGVDLPASAARRSLAAGRRVLLGLRPPQGSRMLDQMRVRAADDPTFGHLATVFAVRAHIFHLPFVQVSTAFLMAECVLGAAAVGRVLSARCVENLLAAAGRMGSPPAQLAAV